MGTLINSVLKYRSETYSSVGGSVFLGVNDKVENWSEITEEEYNEIVTKNKPDNDVM